MILLRMGPLYVFNFSVYLSWEAVTIYLIKTNINKQLLWDRDLPEDWWEPLPSTTSNEKRKSDAILYYFLGVRAFMEYN